MSHSENQQKPFPSAPPSLSAGDHEMRDYYAAQDAPRPIPNQPPYLTPYLGLRARLSQVWINRWTILLLLVLFRTLIAIASLDDNLASAKARALSACTSVENVGSAMASMPYYMSQGVNELTADGIEKAINGLMHMLLMTVTGVEEIILFVINFYISTYVCLVTFAVGGSLHVAINVAEDVGDFLNSTAKDVGKDLSSIANGFETALNKVLSGIDDVGSFLSGHDVTLPTLNLNDSIAKLNSLELPSGYDQGLNKLNGSIPTFAEVSNATNTAIKFPFEEVKKLLNASMGTYTMNRSVFPVPDKEQLTFCSDNDGIRDFFDDLVHIELLAKKIFLTVILVAAVLACIPMAYREIRRWHFMEERARLIGTGTRDPMDSVYLVSRPYTSTAGLKLSQWASSSRPKTLIRWTIAYATTPPALFVLSLAVAGLLACLCQYILLRAIEKEVPVLEHKVEAFADKVVDALNNASIQWAVETNNVINDTNARINSDVFGWVNKTTGAVNETLNVLVDGMMDVLNATFGGTVLYEPVLDVLNCLVLLKVQGIEKGLTWVSDNAYIDFPLLPNNTFSLGAMDKLANDTSSNSSILATGPNSTATDEISSAIDHVTSAIAKGIRQEAIISTCVLMIWVLVVLVGLFRAGYLVFRGGDEGTYHAPPTQNDVPLAPAPTTNHLTGFFPQRHSPDMAAVPTYEQATTDPKDNIANKLNGQSYTLAPRRFPVLDGPGVTSPILSSGFSPSEKIGFVAGQNVEAATRRPTHIRASSHVNFDVETPVDAQPPAGGRRLDHLDPNADRAR